MLLLLPTPCVKVLFSSFLSSFEYNFSRKPFASQALSVINTMILQIYSTFYDKGNCSGRTRKQDEMLVIAGLTRKTRGTVSAHG